MSGHKIYLEQKLRNDILMHMSKRGVFLNLPRGIMIFQTTDMPHLNTTQRVQAVIHR